MSLLQELLCRSLLVGNHCCSSIFTRFGARNDRVIQQSRDPANHGSLSPRTLRRRRRVTSGRNSFERSYAHDTTWTSRLPRLRLVLTKFFADASIVPFATSVFRQFCSSKYSFSAETRPIVSPLSLCLNFLAVCFFQQCIPLKQQLMAPTLSPNWICWAAALHLPPHCTRSTC